MEAHSSSGELHGRVRDTDKQTPRVCRTNPTQVGKPVALRAVIHVRNLCFIIVWTTGECVVGHWMKENSKHGNVFPHCCLCRGLKNLRAMGCSFSEEGQNNFFLRVTCTIKNSGQAFQRETQTTVCPPYPEKFTSTCIQLNFFVVLAFSHYARSFCLSFFWRISSLHIILVFILENSVTARTFVFPFPGVSSLMRTG